MNEIIKSGLAEGSVDTEKVKRAQIELEMAALQLLWEVGSEQYINLKYLCRRLNIPTELCRGVMRSLVDQGLAEFSHILVRDDGSFAGSGWAITFKGGKYFLGR